MITDAIEAASPSTNAVVLCPFAESYLSMLAIAMPP